MTSQLSRMAAAVSAVSPAISSVCSLLSITLATVLTQSLARTNLGGGALPVTEKHGRALGVIALCFGMSAGAVAQWAASSALLRRAIGPGADSASGSDRNQSGSDKGTACEAEDTSPAMRRRRARPVDDAVLETASLAVPSVVSMGVLQLSTLADVVLAGRFAGAASSLGYANLLAMAPIGIVSRSVTAGIAHNGTCARSKVP